MIDNDTKDALLHLMIKEFCEWQELVTKLKKRIIKLEKKMTEKWIQKALSKPSSHGALHRELGVKKGEKIPEKKLEKAENSKNPTERKRANLSVTLKKMHKK